jgi:arylsulfatase A-like enzyme
MCDDLNDYVAGMGGHPQAKTPNIERLMKMGTTFTNAHTNHPVCAPSRASLFSGLYPHTSGLLDWDRWSKSEILSQSVSLFQHFKNNGYEVFGTGKLHHFANDFKDVWKGDDGTSNFGHRPSHGPFPWDGVTRGRWMLHPQMKQDIEDHIHTRDEKEKLWWARGEFSFAPLSDVPQWAPAPDEGVPGYRGWRLYNKPFRYVGENDRDLMPDELSAKWAADLLGRKHDKPFFIAVGFMRPHTPLYVPKKYFDMYPLDAMQLPPYKKGDLEDCKRFKDLIPKYGFQWFDLYEEMDGGVTWRKFVQAYLASITFMDDQLGKILDALEESVYKDNTVVLFTSDHGFHCGEKDYIFKLSNWEESTRVPFIVAAPGVGRPRQTCDHPVSLIDVYPTLVHLCGLPSHPNARTHGYPPDGHSVGPFLQDPAKRRWDGPNVALTVIWGQDERKRRAYHYSVRSKRWRYTLYANGAEELYDHESDPHEWTNLAADPEFAQVKSEMKSRLLQIKRRKRR